MKTAKILVVACAFFLIGGSAFAARATKSATAKQASQTSSQDTAKPAIHHVMGTVASVTDSELALEHEWKGKTEKTMFTLNSDTKKDGNIEKGSDATVFYHYENKERVATEIKVSETKPKTEAKKS